jgi:hypothetical protein
MAASLALCECRSREAVLIERIERLSLTNVIREANIKAR